MNEEKLELLKMQGVEALDIFFDSDEAGQTAVIKVKELADKVGLTYRNIEISGKDPGSLSENAIIKLRRSLYG
jgi:DNA primase